MENVLAGLKKLKDTHPDYRDININESATIEEFSEDHPDEDSETQAEEIEMDAATEQQPDHMGKSIRHFDLVWS